MFRSPGFVLKTALFATGCAGIVAEYVLSTLATYMMGNAVLQWTLVMSLMLFAMGLGSRISRILQARLLDAFIGIEFCLSVLCAVSAVLAYGLAPFISCTNLLIYSQAMIIGGLIGFEIPLVIRINGEYEALRFNISGIMEKDYYGALLGGLLFAFVALPYLGLTYTPIVLGTVNFGVASLILWRFFHLLEWKRSLLAAFGATFLFLAGLGILAQPVITYGEQVKYKDPIIHVQQSAYQKIVMTRWHQYYWLYINGQEQFSTFDEEKYHEPLVHPAIELSANPADVLILGGGDGLAAREVLKHPEVRSVRLVDLDPAMTDLAKTHPVLLTINEGALNDPRVEVINADAARFLETDARLYGTVIIDLPDPDTVELMHVYSRDFYHQVRKHLIRGGVMVAQATSPYFSQKAFLCILKTIQTAGFRVLPYHNQIPTMGEWGWVLGVRDSDGRETGLKERAMALDFSHIPTRFLNRDAMIAMVHFGKGVLDPALLSGIRINSRIQPALYRYYLAGNWGMY